MAMTLNLNSHTLDLDPNIHVKAAAAFWVLGAYHATMVLAPTADGRHFALEGIVGRK